MNDSVVPAAPGGLAGPGFEAAHGAAHLVLPPPQVGQHLPPQCPVALAKDGSCPVNADGHKSANLLDTVTLPHTGKVEVQFDLEPCNSSDPEQYKLVLVPERGLQVRLQTTATTPTEQLIGCTSEVNVERVYEVSDAFDHRLGQNKVANYIRKRSLQNIKRALADRLESAGGESTGLKRRQPFFGSVSSCNSVSDQGKPECKGTNARTQAVTSRHRRVMTKRMFTAAPDDFGEYSTCDESSDIGKPGCPWQQYRRNMLLAKKNKPAFHPRRRKALLRKSDWEGCRSLMIDDHVLTIPITSFAVDTHETMSEPGHGPNLVERTISLEEEQALHTKRMADEKRKSEFIRRWVQGDERPRAFEPLDEPLMIGRDEDTMDRVVRRDVYGQNGKEGRSLGRSIYSGRTTHVGMRGPGQPSDPAAATTTGVTRPRMRVRRSIGAGKDGEWDRWSLATSHHSGGHLPGLGRGHVNGVPAVDARPADVARQAHRMRKRTLPAPGEVALLKRSHLRKPRRRIRRTKDRFRAYLHKRSVRANASKTMKKRDDAPLRTDNDVQTIKRSLAITQGDVLQPRASSQIGAADVDQVHEANIKRSIDSLGEELEKRSSSHWNGRRHGQGGSSDSSPWHRRSLTEKHDGNGDDDAMTERSGLTSHGDIFPRSGKGQDQPSLLARREEQNDWSPSEHRDLGEARDNDRVHRSSHDAVEGDIQRRALDDVGQVHNLFQLQKRECEYYWSFDETVR